MLTTIGKTFDFDAAHSLPFLPSTHKCHRLHGHTYRVEITCTGEPDENGMLIDYSEIAEAWGPVFDILDHQHLNEVTGLTSTTTEMLSRFILERLLGLPGLDRVRVYESSTTYAEVKASP